jgi:hypothetical protein
MQELETGREYMKRFKEISNRLLTIIINNDNLLSKIKE